MKIKTIRALVSFFNHLIYLKLTGKKRPLFVSLQITKICNLRCSYCFAELDTFKDVRDFTTQEWKDIIDELYTLGTRWIRIQGGEPLLRDDIGELIQYIKSKGMICELVTNGMFVRRKIDDLMQLDSLCISLDGDREANDSCRGRGVYDKVTDGIKLAKARGIKTRIHGVLTSYSVNSLEHLVNLAKDTGVEFNVAYFHLDDTKKINEFLLNPKQLKDYYKKYLIFKKKGYPIASSYFFINHILNWPDENGETLYQRDKNVLRRKKLINCLAGRYACFIDADGNLYACPKLWKKGINISEGVKKAWDVIGDLGCISCWAYGDNEAFAIMNLRLMAIWNAITYLFKNRF